MTRTRWATFAVALTVGCVLAMAGVSCGTEPPAPAGDGGEAGSETGADAGDPLDGTLGDGGGILVLEAAPDVPDVCVPAGGCPAGVQCGRYVDCTGQVFVCGAPCPSGMVCTSTGTSPPAQSCQPKSCTGKCGVVGVDSCGVAIGCGGCPAGQDCVANQCVPQSSVQVDSGPADACAPLTCNLSAQTHLCGTIHDGCGQSLQCTCPSGEQCVAGVCSTPPPECDVDGAARCGTVQNACGSGSVACGSCSGANKCVGGACTPCTPPVCGGATCGSVANGCGPAVPCGTCGSAEVCDDGGCCTPMTCGEALDGGLVSGCSPVDLGCGVKKSCQPCGTGEICVNNACQACVPKTCADFGDAGCGHADGCGKSLNCCAQGTTCQGSLCCLPGEVSYNGSCCLPGCDLDQPPGPQVSCGQVIVCNGSSSSGGGGSGSVGTPQ